MRASAVALTLLVACVAGCAADMQLHLMLDKVAEGAVCLDGTPAGFYFSPGTGADKNNWQLYFQGGGWCYKESDCYERSQGYLGSSKSWTPTLGSSGMISADCGINPDFCNYNRVVMQYCDGNSFSGDAAEPFTYNGTKVYLRGKRVLDAIISTLYEKFDFGAANKVLLTGCSAGGLSTILHADYVGSLLPSSVSVYKAAPISGYFAFHANAAGGWVYPDQMKYIFALANSTGGLNDACVAAQAPGDEWRCNFAEFSLAYTETPFFILNSAYDSWQAICILAAMPVPANVSDNGWCGAVAGWNQCSQHIEQCSNPQMLVYNDFAHDVVNALTSHASMQRPGNGAFVHSCTTHCEAQDDGAFVRFSIGGVSMRDALSQWWRGPVSAPASANTYLPCFCNATGLPRQCNPTC